jgi:hypothetical protein
MLPSIFHAFQSLSSALASPMTAGASFAAIAECSDFSAGFSESSYGKMSRGSLITGKAFWPRRRQGCRWRFVLGQAAVDRDQCMTGRPTLGRETSLPGARC